MVAKTHNFIDTKTYRHKHRRTHARTHTHTHTHTHTFFLPRVDLAFSHESSSIFLQIHTVYIFIYFMNVKGFLVQLHIQLLEDNVLT